MRAIIFFMLLGLSLSGRSQSTPHKKAIELNNRAIKVRSESGDLSMKLKKSNLILDSAIKADPKYLMPYSNKLNNLIALGEYQQAIEIAESASKIRPFLEMLTAKGALLQKTGKLPEAKKAYSLALEVGKANYLAKPSANLLCNITVVHLLLNGQQKAFHFLRTEKIKFISDPRSAKQLAEFEKILPKLTLDNILGIRSKRTGV